MPEGSGCFYSELGGTIPRLIQMEIWFRSCRSHIRSSDVGEQDNLASDEDTLYALTRAAYPRQDSLARPVTMHIVSITNSVPRSVDQVYFITITRPAFSI